MKKFVDKKYYVFKSIIELDNEMYSGKKIRWSSFGWEKKQEWSTFHGFILLNDSKVNEKLLQAVFHVDNTYLVLGLNRVKGISEIKFESSKSYEMSLLLDCMHGIVLNELGDEIAKLNLLEELVEPFNLTNTLHFD